MKTTDTRIGAPLARLLCLVLALLVAPAASAAVFVSVGFAPPPLPVYVQPVAPGPGYIWTPGYWAYGPDGYYWVPGTWVLAPYVGALWTPGYWGWSGVAFVWHSGYWGPRVGFYGYFGVGYRGGYWRGGAFTYNTAVNNVSVTNIHNTYNEAVAPNAGVSRVSFNGGVGGVTAQATTEERLAERDQHQPATQLQVRHQQMASSNRTQLASVNHGSPSLLTTQRAAAYTAHSNAPYRSGPAPNMAQGQHYEQQHVQRSPQGAPHPQGQPHGGGGEHREAH